MMKKETQNQEKTWAFKGDLRLSIRVATTLGPRTIKKRKKRVGEKAANFTTVS